MPPKGVAPPSMPKAAPPPPVKVADSSMGENAESSGMAAVMSELTSGGGIQLRKVTADMKTKNRSLTEAEVVPATVPVAQVPTQPVARVDQSNVTLPPVCAIQRSNWVVENYVNHPGMLKLEECTMKQVVYISRCTNSTIYVDCKVKSITLDGCKRVNVIVDSVISSVELVNCERVKVHSVKELPSISIDKCSGVSITLSPQSLDCAFTSSKSSEMNVNVPIGNPDDGDYKEIPIPEQYVHKVVGTGKNSKIETDVSGLY